MKLLLLAIVQSLFLCGAQMSLKTGLARLPRAEWSWAFVRAFLVDWPMLGCGLCYTAAAVLWLYILRHYPFGQAYPLLSLSYVFGVLAAAFFFHEPVAWTGWAGVALILAGCWLIAQ